jgi:flavoprotein
LILRKLIILAAALILGLANGAEAQQVPPYVYPVTLGTTSVQVLPINPARKRVIFVNPNATALVAVCPLGPARNTNVAVVAAINGAGCRTILPYDAFTVDGSGASGPQLYMPSAWVGIASAGSSALTVLEFE